MKRNWHCIAIDETAGWSEDMRARADGPIMTVYLVDLGTRVHCCEVTPSYECHFLYYSGKASTELDIDQFDMDLHSSLPPSVNYFHKLPLGETYRAGDDDWPCLVDTGMPVRGKNGGKKYDESLRAAVDYCCENYPI